MYNLVIGLDISKSTVDATIVRFGSKEITHDSFLNKQLGFKQLTKWSMKFKKEDDQVLFCMEHTGHYAQKLTTFLKQKEFDFAQINPLKIKRSMGFRREKSDKADSKIIGLYGLKFQEDFQVNVLTDTEFLDLQLLLAHRKRIQDKILAFQRQIKYLDHCLSNSCAKKIIRDLKRFKRFFNKEMKRIEQEIDQFVNDYPSIKTNYGLLLSIPGIGRIISLHTILYTKNFKQITCPRKFACYSGVAPFKNESGTSVRKGTRVSFFANRKLKGLLNFGALNAVRIDPQLKAYYQKKVVKCS